MQKARHHGKKSALTACRRTVSGTISLPCCGCFSPFPHGTCPLSVSGECLALADGPAGFTRGSTCPELLRILLGRKEASHKGLSPAMAAFSNDVLLTSHAFHNAVLQPRRNRNPGGLGFSPFARHYWGNHILFSLPPGTKMFQFPGFASCYGRIAGLQPAGLPHSEIPGSKVACTYPGLFAACHVFHRLLEPRHPPYALTYFRLHSPSDTYPKRNVRRICIYLGFHFSFTSFIRKQTK